MTLSSPFFQPVPGHGAAWLVRRPRKSAATQRLFCFHHAGGNANAYLPWSAWLPAHVEVVGVQLPGRGARRHEPALVDPASLVSALGPVLALATQGLPFAFFGHSMGAWLAFEMVQWLAREGSPGPTRLFVSGRGAPHLPLRLAPIDELPDAQMVAAMRRYGGIDDSMLDHPELLQLFLPLIRADLLVHRSHRYRPGAALACPITAIVASDDPLCTVQDVAAWREHTRERFDLQVCSGGHFFFHRDPRMHLAQLLAPHARWPPRDPQLLSRTNTS
jgi:medium-chain acyl-[acyl-carrier-protein] hydrolase